MRHTRASRYKSHHTRFYTLLTKLRLPAPAEAAAAAVFLITCIALFVPPYIGMADNGDFFRVAYGNGLFYDLPDYDSRYLGYFVREYGIFQYHNESGSAVFSSQSLFIRAAIVLNQLLDHPHQFDIRYQAALYTVLYTGAVFMLVKSVTWKMPRTKGYLIAALAVFVFGDTAYTAYFNSFYGESVVLITVMLLLASGLLLYQRKFNDYVNLGIFGISALLLTTSKQQNAPVGVLVAMLAVLLLFIRKERLFRVVAGVLSLTLLAASIGSYVLIPQEFVNINKYHAMTRGVLLHAADPEATLKSFGINPQFAILNHSLYYTPYTTVDVDSELLESEFYSRYGFGSILAYYLTHPDQAKQMLDLAAQHGFTIRPSAMGNYELSAGKPFGAQTSFFSGYSVLKESLAPRTFGFIVLWGLLVLGLYARSFLAGWSRRDRRELVRLPLLLTMMLIGLSGIVVSIVGAGDADLAKHEFLFTIVFDLITFVTVADLIGRQLGWAGTERVQGKPSTTRMTQGERTLHA